MTYQQYKAAILSATHHVGDAYLNRNIADVRVNGQLFSHRHINGTHYMTRPGHLDELSVWFREEYLGPSAPVHWGEVV